MKPLREFGRPTTRRGWRFARALAMVGAVTVLPLPGCGHDPPRQRVRLTDDTGKDPPLRRGADTRVLRIGVASVLSSPSSLPHYKELIAELGERLGVATEMVQRPSYAEMNELLRQRYCSAGFLCNYAFLRAQREFGAEMLAAPIVNGLPTYRAYIIVSRDGPFRSVADLSARRFAFADPMCNAGRLYPLHRAMQVAGTTTGFFAGEIFTYSYADSIRAVAEGAVDGAGVEAPLYDDLIARGDRVALRTRIVDRSPPFGTPPVVVHPQMDNELKGRLRELLLGLHRDGDGRQLLARIGIDRFVEPDPANYEGVRAMAEGLAHP